MARGLGTKSRFAVAYLVLGAVVGTAIGGLIVLVQRPAPLPPPPWSSWRPAATATEERVLEIANHVAGRYKLASGDPLVAVRVGGSQGGTDFQGLVVLKPGEPQALDKEYAKDETVMFILCGRGKNCAIPQGEPSTARGTVLRREALELALYTLEYADPVDNVLVFFPPPKGQTSLKSTLFFTRDDLSSHLKRPLRKTLPQAKAPLPGRIHPREKQTVDQLTGEKLYNYLGISQNFVVIQPPS